MNHISYPKTKHIPLSKISDMNFISFDNYSLIKNQSQSIIIEEKMDGIGIGIGFENGIPYVQQRGHIYALTQLPDYLKELKNWINDKEDFLYELLSEQYCIFGEWLYYKHSIFYDSLPDYFLEYDIYDKTNKLFLSTDKRQQLLKKNSQDYIYSVKVIGIQNSFTPQILSTILKNNPHSQFKAINYFNNFENIITYKKNIEQIKDNTLLDLHYEGFYIKKENKNEVLERYKWIRKSFMDKLLQAKHWKKTEFIKNQLTKVS